MSNYIKMQNASLANISALSAIPNESDYYCSTNTYHASALFFRSAALLPEGEFLGWQLGVGQDKHCSSFAFSSAAAGVTSEDFNWIFRNCAAVSSESPEMLNGFDLEHHKIYILQLRSEECRDLGCTAANTYDDNMDQGNQGIYSEEMLKMMSDAGGVIQIFAASGSEKDQGYGTVFLALPDTIKLRMRTTLSLIFPHTMVSELANDMLLRDGTAKLPAKYITSGMARLLQAFMYKSKNEQECILICDDDELLLEPEDLYNDSGITEITTIDELELSVRAYGSLRRAGISTVGELLAMSDEDFYNIRNLGRKSIAEIKEKLSMLDTPCALLSPAPPGRSASLDELIGLNDVKEQVKKIAAFARMKRDMAEQKKGSVSMALNMEFVGSPGTAKTTVARILAGIFHEMGLLSCSELVEAGRADLVAKYVGQTADRVKSIFRKAKGRLLFIDEAYSLVDAREGDFGDEAITAIVQEMENHREDTIVIFAGYPDKMEGFLARNPGLRSRIPFKISFNDYSIEEMAQIAELEAHKKGFTIHPQAMEKVTAICGTAAARPDAGNGRFCRNLVENAVLNYASRVYGDGGDTGNRDFILTGEDFSIPETLSKVKKTVPIGFRA